MKKLFLIGGMGAGKSTARKALTDEGLVHISEMAGRHIDTPAQVVHAGDDVKVKVMEINPERRRISLSMKAAAEELGFEIDVDESVQAEEKPARRKKDEAPAEAEVVEVETVDAE